jgi:hypothetical protein
MADEFVQMVIEFAAVGTPDPLSDLGERVWLFGGLSHGPENSDPHLVP